MRATLFNGIFKIEFSVSNKILQSMSIIRHILFLDMKSGQ